MGTGYSNESLKEVIMKKLIPLFCALGCLAQPAFAANNITTLSTLVQSDFRALSEDLGSALSYKPVMPTAALGTTGFDLGFEVTQTKMAQSSQVCSKITSGGNSVSSLYMPKLHIDKGLPFGIDIAAFYSKIPTTNITLTGAELRYALIDGGVTTPAVALRVATTKLSGVNVLSLSTKSADLSISKGFTLLTPYAGVGQVWTTSTPNGVPALVEEKFTQSKVFGGVNLNLGMTNICLEMDKTGAASSTSLKLGFRW
jgi:hypothetical protein